MAKGKRVSIQTLVEFKDFLDKKGAQFRPGKGVYQNCQVWVDDPNAQQMWHVISNTKADELFTIPETLLKLFHQFWSIKYGIDASAS